MIIKALNILSIHLSNDLNTSRFTVVQDSWWEAKVITEQAVDWTLKEELKTWRV